MAVCMPGLGVTVGRTDTDGHAGAPRVVGVLGLLLTYAPLFAVAAVWCVARIAGVESLAVVGWLPGALALGVAAWYLYRASRAPRLGPEGRRFWRRLAIAAALIAPSTNPLTKAKLGQAQPGILLTVAVSLLVAALFLMLWALLRLPVRSRGPGDRVRLGLDAATVLICAATFLWHFVLAPLVRPDVNLLLVLGLLALCLLCLLAVLAVVKLMLAGTDTVDTAALHALASVVVVGAIGSGLVPVLADPRLDGVSNLITATEGLLAGLAAVLQIRAAGTARTATARRRTYSVLPYLAVGAIDALLVGVSVRGGGHLPVVIAAVSATAIVAARQLLAFRDNATLVASLQEHQRLLRWQATHDTLTGLPNRALFNEELAAAVAAPGPLTALLIDLDDFKTVNDTLGHSVGDALLVEVGHRMRSAVRPGDLVARFAVLLPDTAVGAGVEVAVRILAALDAPVQAQGHPLMAAASIGLAEWNTRDDRQTLLRHADIAMYAAKRMGKNRYASYTPDLDSPVPPNFGAGPPQAGSVVAGGPAGSAVGDVGGPVPGPVGGPVVPLGSRA